MANDPYHGLEPKQLWTHFAEFTRIARPSEKEEELRKYIEGVAASHGFGCAKDDAGNLRVRIPASSNAANNPKIVLQGHMDMVCTRDADAGEYDPSLGKIRVFRARQQGNDVVEDPNGEWLKADRTTLGADNGIGVAAMLAVAVDPAVSHGPLDLLFTVQEEAGLIGAAKLDPHIVNGKILLNLDSEDEGVFTIGSAGGRETGLRWFHAPQSGIGAKMIRVIAVSGLLGGHSGVDIHRGRLNAIAAIVRVLQGVAARLPIQISTVEGGDRSNAIPREARAIVVIAEKDEPLLKEAVDAAAREIVAQYQSIEPNIKIDIDSSQPIPPTALSVSRSARLLDFLRAIPSGVIAMSQALPGLVETSTNLGVAKSASGAIDVICNSRSSVTPALEDVTARLVSIATLAGASAAPSQAYPGWSPDPNSPMLKILKENYKKLFGKDAEVAAVHAGLECGVLNGKIPDLDMVSFGPTIVGAHSTRERVNIESVARFYKLLATTLSSLDGQSNQSQHTASPN